MGKCGWGSVEVELRMVECEWGSGWEYRWVSVIWISSERTEQRDHPEPSLWKSGSEADFPSCLQSS